jgi:phage terminase small subunit
MSLLPKTRLVPNLKNERNSRIAMMDVTPRKRLKGKREAAVLEPFDASYGPAMAALNEKQRLFVLALFESPKKFGAATFAARAAGYGSPTSSAQSFASIASRLCANPMVQEAIQEMSRQYVTTMGPLAVRALKNLLGDKAAKEHGRALGIVMDRIAPQQSTHTVNVNHHAVDHSAEAVAQLRMLRSLDVAREKLEEVFGFSGLSRYEKMLAEADARAPKLIEGTVNR